MNKCQKPDMLRLAGTIVVDYDGELTAIWGWPFKALANDIHERRTHNSRYPHRITQVRSQPRIAKALV